MVSQGRKKWPLLPGEKPPHIPKLAENPRETPNRLHKFCVHLGKLTGDTTLIPCPTCNGNVRIKYPTRACDLHGQCLPSVAADRQQESEVKLCQACDDRTPEK